MVCWICKIKLSIDNLLSLSLLVNSSPQKYFLIKFTFHFIGKRTLLKILYDLWGIKTQPDCFVHPILCFYHKCCRQIRVQMYNCWLKLLILYNYKIYCIKWKPDLLSVLTSNTFFIHTNNCIWLWYNLDKIINNNK